MRSNTRWERPRPPLPPGSIPDLLEAAVRRYDEPVEVRRGLVSGPDAALDPTLEGPEQFLWHGRLWKVRAVLARWVETGAWWERHDDATVVDLLAERELWRVEAGAGALDDGGGVFELSFDTSDGRWQLVSCQD